MAEQGGFIMFTKKKNDIHEEQFKQLFKEAFGIPLNKNVSCLRPIESVTILHGIIEEQYLADDKLQKSKDLELLRIEQHLHEMDIVENKPALLVSAINIFSILFAVTSFFVSMGATILALSAQLNIAAFESYLQVADDKKDLVMIFGEGTAKSNSLFSVILHNMNIWPIIFLILLVIAFSWLKYMDSVGVIRRSAERTFYTLYKNIITK